MSDIELHQPQSLVIAESQTNWTDDQAAGLRHIGVQTASPADLRVYFHVCQRTGLDPFARQIYMIEREGKQTIQTGIDGFRLVGRRAAARAGETIAMGDAEWCHEDGTWRPVWRQAWGVPVAARITVFRDGQPFPAVALYDEYVQTRRDGKVTAMWRTRPAGQLAKCAEALAWRKAFPQDLSGLYASDEMSAAEPPQVEPKRGLAAVLAKRSEPAQPKMSAPTEPEPPTETGELRTEAQSQQMHALFRANSLTRDEALGYVNAVLEIGEYVTSTKTLTVDQASRVIRALEAAAEPVEAEPIQGEVE